MFLFHSEFKGLRTSKPVLEFQSKGWQAQEPVFQVQGRQAGGILSYLGENQPFCFI